MNLTSEQLAAAMAAATALTNPADDRCYVPMRHAGGALILHQLAVAMQNGEFALTPAQQRPADEPPADDPPPPPPPRKPRTKK